MQHILLERAKSSSAVRQNAWELLCCLSFTTARESFAGNPEELKKILLTTGVASALWSASTAVPLHYRFQQRLIEVRAALITLGVAEDQLPVPEWLAE
jgi:hypothetical protein